MLQCFFLVFGYSFYLFFFLFWILSWLLCSITSAHILLHEYCQQSSCVSGWVHDKRLVSLCCEWLRPSDTLRELSTHYIVIKTLRRASVLSSDRRGFMVSICVEISWTCLGSWKDVLFVASLTSCCRCCSLIWLLLSKFAWIWCSLAMQRKVLGWFYFRYFGFFMARDQSRPSVDPPRGCVNQDCQVVISKKSQINLQKKPNSTEKSQIHHKYTTTPLKHPNALL